MGRGSCVVDAKLSWGTVTHQGLRAVFFGHCKYFDIEHPQYSTSLQQLPDLAVPSDVQAAGTVQRKSCLCPTPDSVQLVSGDCEPSIVATSLAK